MEEKYGQFSENRPVFGPNYRSNILCSTFSPNFNLSLCSPKRLERRLSLDVSDRFIPIREPENWNIRFNMDVNGSSNFLKNTEQLSDITKNGGLPYQCLLRNELLGDEIDNLNDLKQKTRLTSVEKGNVFRFRTREIRNEVAIPYSRSPLSNSSQKMLIQSRKLPREICKLPYKVLDAPKLEDDFYLNLLDWSSKNVLAVGLGSMVYLWNASTCNVVARLCDSPGTENPYVTSVCWSAQGDLVSVGTSNGFVQIWDVAAQKCIRKLHGHTARVSCLSWNGGSITSGSRDRCILHRDVRSNSVLSVRRFIGHHQEVCGLKWSPDLQLLASGGNDNQIFIWNPASRQPKQGYGEHFSAVKAIAWSPHNHGLLASGGGTADRCIRFWNTVTGQSMQSVDTGSQVCNLAWSKHIPELVSTHGYSENHIFVWKYPAMKQVAKLTGHQSRVLYLAMSPNGEAIVTGAGDETIRFWNVFPKIRPKKETKSALDLFSAIR